MTQRLPHRIRSTLIPMRAFRRLFSRQYIDKTLGKEAESVSLVNVSVERFRVVLGQNKDSVDSRVDAIADWDVDKSVFASQRNCRFRPDESQWKQPTTFTATQHDRKYVFHKTILAAS